MISCCDSRVDPGVLFDLEPGEIFVIRNVANLVPPFETKGDYHGTSAALQFAVICLQVKHVVVLGHAGCRGTRALMESDSTIQTDGFIDSWMSITPEQRIDACEITAVIHSINNLTT